MNKQYVLKVLRKGKARVFSCVQTMYRMMLPDPREDARLRYIVRKTLVIDMDETMIHSCNAAKDMVYCRKGSHPNFAIDLVRGRCYIRKRPYLDHFLQIVDNWFDIVVYTASSQSYATKILNILDSPHHVLRRRYFRQHCQLVNGNLYRKNLSMIRNDLENIFIIDDTPEAYADYPYNALPIASWHTNPFDTALYDLLPLLESLISVEDVRTVICELEKKPQQGSKPPLKINQ